MRFEEGDQAFGFLGTDAFTGAGGELRYRTKGGVSTVFGDVDGDRAADFAINARVTRTLLRADGFLL